MATAIQESVRHSTAGTTNRWSIVGAERPGSVSQVIPVVGPQLRIGRACNMDLVLDSPTVSSSHAELLQSMGNLFLRDTGSTNGTWVNGRRVTHDVILSDGDVLEMGDTCFRVCCSAGTSMATRTDPMLMKTQSTGKSVDRRGGRKFAELMERGRVLPCFQAIHCLASGGVVGYEFLARSSTPGLETAGELFEQARLAGREVELSMKCRADALTWSHLVPADVPIFLNTHPLEPILEQVVPQMKQLRRQYPHRNLVLEIHEAAIMEPHLVRQLRDELASVDVRLAFDDFGRGQARIRELICAPSDFIKFDSALISDLQDVSEDQFRFFASVIRGIREEGAITIAEGIETEEMAQICREVGFDMVQGFLFSRPTILGR